MSRYSCENREGPRVAYRKLRRPIHVSLYLLLFARLALYALFARMYIASLVLGLRFVQRRYTLRGPRSGPQTIPLYSFSWVVSLFVSRE